jgi:hypothetical protein
MKRKQRGREGEMKAVRKEGRNNRNETNTKEALRNSERAFDFLHS